MPTIKTVINFAIELVCILKEFRNEQKPEMLPFMNWGRMRKRR